VLGLTGVLIVLIVLTIVLAGVFLVRPSVTGAVTGKVLAFVGLCVLPALCIGTGLSFHMQRSQQTAYCISCHSMETHGESLHLEDMGYIPAQHFQNHLVPPDAACYTCHTDYTMYGPLKDKLKGLRYLYMEYVSTPPKTIHLDGKYSNLQCLHCHADARNFEEYLNQMPPISELTSNRISCLSSGCHDMIHNASEVGHLKMWNGGATSTALVSGASTPASAKAEPAVTTGPSKAGSTAGGARAAGGKAVFDSHGCAGCHGEGGAGGSGPALTNVSSQYPPAKLTAVLKAPNAKMKAAGMVPLTLSAADMKGLVSYVIGLGGTPASAATPSSPGASAPAPAKAEPAATAGTSKTPTGGAAGGATTAAGGKAIFDSHGCSGCHGESGAGGSGPALTDISSKYPPAKLTAVLKAPTAGMKAAGMVDLTLSAADMKALVSYVTSLGGTASASPSHSPGAPPPAPAKAEPDATAGTSKVKTGSPASDAATVLGKSLYHSHGCGPCHGATGAGGAGPALTHISDQYSPAKLTAILKAPTAGMKAAGMIPVTLNAADMDALVSYVTSLGGTSASAAPLPASGSASPAPAKAESDVKAESTKAKAGRSTGGTTAAGGKAIFDSQGCAGCHGESGAGGSGPALTDVSSRYPPAKLTAVLKAPTAKMKAAGMGPLTLSAADMKGLVSYVSSLGGK
jgi:cytochrome c-type protein NapC